MAVGKRDLECGIAGHHAESVIDEMEVADHFGAEHARYVGSCGSTATRSDFFGDAASADDVAAFEHKGGVSGAGKISGSGEAVVATADDDGVINQIWTARHAADHWSKQEKAPVEETNESP